MAAGLRPDPLGQLKHPDPLAAITGPTSKGRGREGKGREGGEREGREEGEGEREGALFQGVRGIDAPGLSSRDKTHRQTDRLDRSHYLSVVVVVIRSFHGLFAELRR